MGTIGQQKPKFAMIVPNMAHRAPFILNTPRLKIIPSPHAFLRQNTLCYFSRASLSFFCFLFLTLLSTNNSLAQGFKLLKGYRFRTSEDKPLAGAGRSSVTAFPNVNNIAYFSNPDLLRKVQQYTRKKQNGKLVRALEEYVLSFGIVNFYRNPNMLWQLARLYEDNGQPEKAKNLYRLAIKHSRTKLSPNVRSRFDSLDEPSRTKYVALKYYYELLDYRRSIDTLIPPRSILTPLNENVNSPFEEYGVAVNRATDTLLFTSRRKNKKTQITQNSSLDEDIFVSRGSDDFWEEAVNFEEINTSYNEGSPTLGPDGKTIYFSRCMAPGGYGSCDIFCCTRMPNGKWSKPQNLGPGVNGRAWDSQPSLSHSGDTLYFASDRLGGFGLSDIYVSVRKNGIWTQAQNLGPNLNTMGNEVSPNYHPKYKVLYFSSDNQLVNFGLFDIFKSYFRNGQWQEPQNIGPLVNGSGSEYYFTIDYQSKNLYYARSDSADAKNLDLYSFPLPMEAQPLATTRLDGNLTDSAGQPMVGIVSVIDLDNGIEVAPRELRKDGGYDFDLIRNNNYLLIIQGDDFFRIEQMLTLQNDTAIVQKAKRISAQKISFSSVDFEQDSYEILPIMTRDLDNVLNFLIDHPTYKIRIAGHTDLTGDTTTNLKLSQNRANSIKAYLTATNLVLPARIEAIGFGSKKPIIPTENTEADRRTNRRVEFEILYPEKKVKQE